MGSVSQRGAPGEDEERVGSPVRSCDLAVVTCAAAEGGWRVRGVPWGRVLWPSVRRQRGRRMPGATAEKAAPCGRGTRTTRTVARTWRARAPRLEISSAACTRAGTTGMQRARGAGADDAVRAKRHAGGVEPPLCETCSCRCVRVSDPWMWAVEDDGNAPADGIALPQSPHSPHWPALMQSSIGHCHMSVHRAVTRCLTL